MTGPYFHLTTWQALRERDELNPSTFTPWPRGWRRELYERTVPRFWPLLTAGTTPDRPAWPLLTKGLKPVRLSPSVFLRQELEWRIGPVAGHLAYGVVPVAVQRGILTNAGTLREPSGRCWEICELPGWMPGDGNVVADDWVRHQFTHQLSGAISWALGGKWDDHHEWARAIPKTVHCPPEWVQILRAADDKRLDANPGCMDDLLDWLRSLESVA